MSEERRLRQEIAEERAELADAVGDLREELQRAKRKLPAVVGGGLAALAALRFALRKLRRR